VVKPILITASRLIDEKGVDNVLRAFKLVSAVYPNAKLYIAGDGPNRIYLEAEVIELGIENHVVFLGHIDQRELIELMRMSHFFVLMSRYRAERLPNVIKEAMLQGCVVVSTLTDGITELVRHSNNGFLNSSGTPEETASYVFDCIENQILYKEVSESAVDFVMKYFDSAVSMSEYVLVWDSLRAGHGGASGVGV